MRGVNKLVVEVRPDSDHFEKALLFIRPEARELPQKEISDSAEKLLSDISSNKNYASSNHFRSFLLIFSGLTAGSILSFIIMFIANLF